MGNILGMSSTPDLSEVYSLSDRGTSTSTGYPSYQWIQGRTVRIACKCEDWPQMLHSYPGQHSDTSHHVKVCLKNVSWQKLNYQSDPKNACSSIVSSVFFFVAFLYSSTAASFTLCSIKDNYNNKLLFISCTSVILFQSDSGTSI